MVPAVRSYRQINVALELGSWHHLRHHRYRSGMTCIQLGLCPMSLYWTFIYLWHICSPCSHLSYKHCLQDVKLLYPAQNASDMYNTTAVQQLTESWFNLSLATGEATELSTLFCVCNNAGVHLCGRCPGTQALENRP